MQLFMSSSKASLSSAAIPSSMIPTPASSLMSKERSSRFVEPTCDHMPSMIMIFWWIMVFWCTKSRTPALEQVLEMVVAGVLTRGCR